MRVSFKECKNECINVKYLHCDLGVRYFEDATLTMNGCSEDDDDDNPKIPGVESNGEDFRWCPIIDVECGRIVNWKKGISADIHYKVCDNGAYMIANENDDIIYSVESYVPLCLSIGENGYGDYVILTVDEDGFIEDWKFNDSLMVDLLSGDFARGEDFSECDEDCIDNIV